MSIRSEIIRISDEVGTQTDLIEQIKSVLQTKSAGGKIPEGWEAAYTEETITSETVDVDFTFTDCGININDCLVCIWSDEITQGLSKRVAVVFVNFANPLSLAITYLCNTTSTGSIQASGQVPGTDISLSASGGDVTASVAYVSTRRFMSGKKYKAIIIGKEASA